MKTLKHVYEDGSKHRMPEEICCMASYYAGCAFTKSYVGYVHAVAHSLGGEYNVPHGLANADPAAVCPGSLRKRTSGPNLNRPGQSLLTLPQKIPNRKSGRTHSLFLAIQGAEAEHLIFADTVPEIREEDIPKLAHLC